MLLYYTLIEDFQTIGIFIILLLVNKIFKIYSVNFLVNLEHLAAKRSNEMVKLLTKTYGYKQVSIELSGRINTHKKLLSIL